MAQVFKSIAWDPKQCRIEVDEFGAFLEANPELSERKAIQPFFRDREQLTACIGSYLRGTGFSTEICFEYQFYNDFAADLIVGIKSHRRYCVIEFEDGRSDSIFKPSRNKNARNWSPRFEHGFSQIVDWYSMLDDLKKTERFKRDFGHGHIRFSAMLVIGRDSGLTDLHDRFRLDWRTDKVSVDSNHVECLTFDELHRLVDRQLELWDGL